MDPKTEPWGTPHAIGIKEDLVSLKKKKHIAAC